MAEGDTTMITTNTTSLTEQSGAEQEANERTCSIDDAARTVFERCGVDYHFTLTTATAFAIQHGVDTGVQIGERAPDVMLTNDQYRQVLGALMDAYSAEAPIAALPVKNWHRIIGEVATGDGLGMTVAAEVYRSDEDEPVERYVIFDDRAVPLPEMETLLDLIRTAWAAASEQPPR